MSEEQAFDGISGLKQSESDIRHTFNRYIKNLFNEKWKIADEMTEWSKKLIDQIQEYVTQQRNLLEEEYAKKLSRLNILRDRFIEQALLYEEKNDTEQINQLLKQCNTLNVQLALLVYIDRPIASIQLITEEQLTQQNPDEYNVHKTEDEQSQKKLIESPDNDIAHNTNANESSSPKPSSTTLPSPVTKSTTAVDQSINNLDKLENTTSSHNGLIEKCPICFMIFPQPMTAHDRNIHINEHYKDD